MWLGTIVHLSISAAMNDELEKIKVSLGEKTQEPNEIQNQFVSKKTNQSSKDSPTPKNSKKPEKIK